MLTSISYSALLALLLAAETAFGAPHNARSEYAVKDTHHVPRKWAKVGPPPSNHRINLQIGLKQSQFLELERHLYEVSDPRHHRYGQHLSEAEVNDLVKPTDDALELVHEWLFDFGIEASDLSYSPAKDWIKVTLPVDEVETLLDTEYSIFENEDGGQIVRTPKWSLPKHLHEHIDVIQPTNSFFRPLPKRSTLKTVKDQGNWKPSPPKVTYPSDATLQQVCNETAVTPLCLRTLYGTANYTVQAAGRNKVGLNDFLGESNNRSDAHLFLEQYRPEAAQAAYQFQVEIIDNGNNEQTQENATELAAGKDLEGNLDAQTILGITWPTPLTAFTTGGSPPFTPDDETPTDTNEPYLAWLQHVLAQSNLPQVISTSYDDDEQTVPKSYATSVCNGFAQLGARGISLLFAAGDGGVGGDGGCYTNDGKNTSTFLPEFPSTCPYITAVGATMNFDPEIVAFDALDDYSSGGGFSSYFSRPWYQDEVVPAYVKSLNGAFSGLYNPNGRGYPDISAQGFHFITTWNGSDLWLDGTSAATPAASSILSLVNDALIAEGKPPLGFLNPWLYQGGYKAFTDITSGSAIGCGTAGFPAQKGWDAVSGWGTPYFPAIKGLFGCK